MPKFKTQDEWEQDVFSMYGDEYVPVGKYIRSSKKVCIFHKVCSTFFMITPNNFLRGKKCPKKCCKISNPMYPCEVYKETEGKFRCLDEYSGYDKPLEYLCLKHNHTFCLSPISFRRSTYKCELCKYEHSSLVQRKDEKDFLQDLYNKHGGHIIAQERYRGTHTKIWFKCLECDTKFKSEPNSVTRISGCPECNSSHGETQISRYLDKHNIFYTPQKRFVGCKRKRPLPFDFYLKAYNLLIEYDGLQHSIPVDFWGGEEYLKDVQERDGIKNEFAIKNNITLIRIPYSEQDEDIDRILNSYFKGLELHKQYIIS